MLIPEKQYREITQIIPIPCVDLLAVDQTGQILLLKRVNEPAKGRWWLPGGRIHFGETRKSAAVRKLFEECGLNIRGGEPIETMTGDIIVPDGKGGISHTISMVFSVQVDSFSPLTLDSQSEKGEWRQPQDWLADDVDPFVRKALARHVDGLDNSSR
jgi:ADP-ribose pyrophosphatase YjhB (NUDIX family)